jgi:hypothetical protein
MTVSSSIDRFVFFGRVKNILAAGYKLQASSCVA